MSLTLELPPDLEANLTRNAALHHLSLPGYALAFLRKAHLTPCHEMVPRLSCIGKSTALSVSFPLIRIAAPTPATCAVRQKPARDKRLWRC